MADIFKNDIGTIFRITIKNEVGAVVNLSAATSMKLYIKRPGGAALVKDLQFVNDGSDGVVSYTVIAGDLAYAGSYTMQAKVTLPEGEWYTTVMAFTARAPLV